MASVIQYKESGNPLIDLLNGASDGNVGTPQWATNTLTYSFPTSASSYNTPGAFNEVSGFMPTTAIQQAMVSEILKFYASVSGLTFTLVPDTGTSDLQFGMSSTVGAVARGYDAGQGNNAGDVWFSSGLDEWSYGVVIHEIGHVLGLRHATDLPAYYKTATYTVMPSSTHAQTPMILDIAAIQQRYGANFNTNSGNTTYTWNPSTDEMFVNGVGQGTLSGVGGSIRCTIWDGDGIDTYDFSNFYFANSIDLRPGRWTTVDKNGQGTGIIANALLYKDANGVEDVRSLIENAIGGSGNDSIVGNQAANTLRGWNGNDVIDGGAGNDTIYGGSGDDVIEGGSGSDHLYGESGNVFAADPTGAITDYIYDFGDSAGNEDVIDLSAFNSGVTAANFAAWKSSNVTQSGSNAEIRFGDDKVVLVNVQVSNLDYSDFKFIADTYGTSANDTLTGGNGYDTIYGLAGNDTLYGLAGKDTLEGGAGADVIYGGDGDDIIRAGGTDLQGDVIDGGEGVDTLQLTSTVTVSAFQTNNYRNVENIDGNGFGFRGTAANDLIDLSGFMSVTSLAFLDGGAGDDTLYGTIGDDTIVGGAGADRIYGGFGNDIIRVGGTDLQGDMIDGGEGVDTLQLTSTVTASVFQRYSGLTPNGFYSVENIDGNGFGIQGTTGNDFLELGKFDSVTGVAFVDGGAGDDYILGCQQSDDLRGGDGNDEIRGGAGNDTLDGGNGNDKIYGQDGNDILNGGAGADTMQGGAGNDIYVVDNVGDIVDESVSGSGGIDTVQSSVTYSLAASTTVLGTVENLTLTGSANINGTGNSADNVIIGNSGANLLVGDAGNDTLDGGAGADTMRGGSGNDIYVVDNVGDIVDESVAGSAGADTVQSSISYSLVNSGTLLGAVENLTLTGSAAINGAGNALNNVIIGNAGDNTLDGGEGNDTLEGGDGADTLNGGVGNDILRGGTGMDWLNGGDGDDTLDGGTGVNDVLHGGNGSDTYLYSKSYNYTVISDNGYVDTAKDKVQFIDLNASGIIAFWDGPDLEIIIKATDENLRIANQLYDNNHIESFVFADGTVWSDVTMGNAAKSAFVRGNTSYNTLTGTSADEVLWGRAGGDVLNGEAGNDILLGGAGNDTLTGGAGNDLFVFAPGFGKDTITDFAAGAGVGDVIEFNSPVFANFASVLAKATQVGADTVITYDANNSLTLKNVALSSLHANDFQFFA